MRGIMQSIALAMVLVAGAAVPTTAQQPGANRHRDCQVVRTCNFSRNSPVRGCLSSYTCRTCWFVVTRCSIGIQKGPCRELVCSWGG